ncbi:MAG: glycogen-binding domain-containing protein [Balneolaceae bacterium]
MRIILLGMIGLVFIPLKGYGQDWQAVFMLDSKSGYTSNTYLNPIIPDWDRTTDAGYVMISPLGQIGMSSGRFSSDVTAGFVYEPFFDNREAWSGGFALLGTRIRIADKLSMGLEGGASKFSSFVSRDLYWLQPVLQWSPSLFTQVRFKAGSTFRKLSDETTGENQDTERFDSYTVQFETWPTMKWQLRSSVFGNLSDPTENLGIRLSADYRISRKFQLNFYGGIERYSYEVVTENGGGGGGFPPVGGGPGGGSTLADEADRLIRAGTGVSYQVNQNISLSLNSDLLNYYSSATEETSLDAHLSGGIRIALFPKIGNRGKADMEVRQNGRQTVILNLNHDGDGELFLTGEFNGWNKPGIPLSRQKRNTYVTRLSLDPGAYEYKILKVNGSEEEWIEFSDDTYTVPDGFGDRNGLMFID